MLIRWASFKNLEDVKKEVATFMPNKQNPVVVRFVTRSELAAIPKDRYSVRIIKVRVPRMKSGESDGEEEIQVAITDTLLQAKQLKKIRSKIRDLKRKKNGGGGGGGDEPPANPFHEPIDQDEMADCIIQVMDDFFYSEDKCTIYEKEYNRMEFCVLMHIFFKKTNFLKKKSRLSFSNFMQNKVLVGKSGFVRTYNKYADKAIFKDFEKQLDIKQYNFKKHSVPLPPEKMNSLDYHQRMMIETGYAFQEIGWAFQKKPYFEELKDLKKTMNKLVIQ